MWLSWRIDPPAECVPAEEAPRPGNHAAAAEGYFFFSINCRKDAGSMIRNVKLSVRKSVTSAFVWDW
jgi:hypothetical protein